MVLTKQTPCIHVGGQEVAIAGQGALWREARHVCNFHDMLEIVAGFAIRPSVDENFYLGMYLCLRHVCRYVNSVLPFELGPHASELGVEVRKKDGSEMAEGYLSFITICGFDIIHNIDVNIA